MWRHRRVEKMKRISVIFTVCLCLSVLLSACGKRTDVGKDDSFIYCLNEDRTGLIKIACEFPQGDTAEKAETVLAEMKKPAEEIEYTTPLPKDVEVRHCDLRGSILDVDFNNAYLEMGALEEKLVRAAVVQSLVLIDGINAVSFTVDGEQLTDSSGMPIGLMNADDFVENTGSSPSAYQTDTLTLYFANSKGDSLVAQKMDVRYSSNVSREKLIVEKLMQGPSGNDAYPTVNPDANLLSVTIKDGICYVNFDNSFLTGAYDVLPEVTIYSIVNSLVEGTEAQQVQFTINGETNVKYMEAVDLSQPLEEKEELVAAEE